MDGLDELSDSGGCATARHPLLHVIISRQVRCHFDMSVCWYINQHETLYSSILLCNVYVYENKRCPCSNI